MTLRIDQPQVLLTWRRFSGALGAATALKSGKANLTGYSSVRGQLFADGTQTAATLVINHYDSSGNVLHADTITLDSSQAASTWTWDVPLMGAYVQVAFTSDGAATVVRAFNEAVS